MLSSEANDNKLNVFKKTKATKQTLVIAQQFFNKFLALITFIISKKTYLRYTLLPLRLKVSLLLIGIIFLCAPVS